VSAHSETPDGKQATKSIRDVLDFLSKEFPDVTVSKIRFLESRGLIHPERNASGYRKFSDEDIERLRWILRQQRENFLPLKVIKGRLEQAGATLFSQSLFESVVEGDLTPQERSAVVDQAFDDDDFNQDPDGVPIASDVDLGAKEKTPSGGERPTPPSSEDKPGRVRGGSSGGGPRPPRRPARQSGRDSERRSAEALAKSARVDLGFIDELAAFSLIEGEGEGEDRTFPVEAARTVELAARLRGYGIELRHLRTFKHAAEREAGVLEQVVLPMLRRHNPEAQKRARAVLDELVETGDRLHEVFLRAALREIDTR
jgi:DNA-binding transcriptional MerR regulator